MTDTQVFEKKENMPLESYNFTYSEAEYDEINKSNFSNLVARAVVFGVLTVAVTVGVIIGGELEFFGGFLCGWTLLYFILSLTSLLKGRKNWKISKAKVCSGVYKYELFENHMLLTVTRNGECEVYTKLEYENLNWKRDTGRFYLLAFTNNQMYIVKKQEIAENSIFHSLKPKAPEKPSKSLKSLSVVLMVLTIVILVCAMFSAVAVNINSIGVVRYWWYPYVFSFVPILSFGLGVFMKGKYNSGKGNIFTGILAVVLILCIYFALNNII